MNTKVCTRCNLELAVDQFTWASGRPVAQCKACRRKISNSRYAGTLVTAPPIIYGPEIRKQIVDLRLQGMQTKDIADQLGLKKTTVVYILIQEGIQKPKGVVLPRTSKETIQKILAERAANPDATLEDIASKLGTTRNIIKYVLTKSDQKLSHDEVKAKMRKARAANSFSRTQNQLMGRSFAAEYPHLLNKWSSENTQSPTGVFISNTNSFKWICVEGHQWKSRIRSIVLGFGCPVCRKIQILKSNGSLATVRPDVASEWHPSKNINITPFDVSPGAHIKAWWLCSNGHEWESYIYSRTASNAGCKNCSRQYTNLEKFVEERLQICKFDLPVLSNKKWRPDFKLTDKIYMNVDGLYWHSDRFRGKVDHFNYRVEYEKSGLRLLQFYGDEVLNKWPIVESIIKNATGKIGTSIGARKLELRELSRQEAMTFLDANHLMGCGTTFKGAFGLFGDELLCAMTYNFADGVLKINRFATYINLNCPGGFSKILKMLISKFAPERVVSHCNLRYATGISYEKFGFKNIHEHIGFCWVDKNSAARHPRHSIRTTDNKTQTQIAAEMGWSRLWDAGQRKYELRLS